MCAFHAFAVRSRVSAARHTEFKTRRVFVTAGSTALSVHYRENYTVARMKVSVLRGLGRGDCACERGSLILHEIISSFINYPAYRSE